MRKVFITTVVGIAALIAPVANGQDLPTKGADVSDPRFLEATLRQQWAAIGEDLDLRKIDQAALGEAKKWQSGEHAPPPVAGKEGRVVFALGATLPKIVCAVQEICDIELQRGERVNDVKQGDQRFLLEPAMSGETVHVIVRPLVGNIRTHAAIYTDRRVYHLDLQASKDDTTMTFVSFTYPEDQKVKWFAMMSAAGEPSVTGEPRKGRASSDFEITANPGALHFGYEIEKEGRWRIRRRINWEPTRVYDDGEKTIIEMPRSILAREMPILLIRDGDGSDKIANYRVKGQHFVVDRLFDKAVLVKGVGRRQERVSIQREVE